MPKWVIVPLLLGCLGTFTAPVAQALQTPSISVIQRTVNIRDAITMTETGDRDYLDVFTRSGNVALFSPDRSKFAFVTQKGNLAHDTVDFSLWVFYTSDVSQTTRPTITFSSSSNREAISHVQWLADNRTLTFIGEQPEQNPQVYRVDSMTKIVERQSTSPTGVVSYAMSRRANALVYIAEANPTPAISTEMRSHGFAVTTQQWDELYSDKASTQDFRKLVFIKTPSMKTPRQVGGTLYYWKENMPVSVSPDGRFAIVTAFATNPSSSWSKYKVDPDMVNRFCDTARPYLCPEQYFLINLQAGTVRPLVDAPRMRGIGNGDGLFSWTTDNSLLLINALLPLDGTDPVEQKRRQNTFYTVEIFPSSGRLVTIDQRREPYVGDNIHAEYESDRFVIQPSNATYGAPTEFRRDERGWHIAEVRPSAESKGQLSVTLDEGLNSPPKLMLNDPKTQRKTLVLDLNPQFAKLKFGHVELFHWMTRDGRDAEGTLYFPAGYVPGKKYPLVIQTHGQSRERFWIDGPFSTVSAAQALAGSGFMVLQMGVGDRYQQNSLAEWTKVLDTSQEAGYVMLFFDSAVDELDRRGLIDKDDVGITGFSRTVYHVLYSLTHSDHKFRAAVIADGVNFGYVGCLYYFLERNSVCERMNGGGPPFGTTLAGWEKAPTFNLDKVQAPVLLQAISAPLGEWEIFAGLRWLKKPVELISFYPEGEHILVKPQQRLLSQGSVVDWYRFWLKDEEDPDPSKTEQYKRWHELRELQEKALLHHLK